MSKIGQVLSKIGSKFMSRKFLLALLGDIIGVVMLVSNQGEGDLQCIASIILIVVSTLAYISNEAKIDAAAVSKVSASIEDIAKIIEVMLNNDDDLISKTTDTTNDSEKGVD